MKNDFLIVHKSILPENLDAVIEARILIQDYNKSVSDASKEVGISRSTFYKYKDYVFSPQQELGKKAIIGMKLDDLKGVLSNTLNYIANHNCNILAINQEMPINNTAFVTLTIDVIGLEVSYDEFLTKIRDLNGVKTAELIAIE